MSDHPNAGWLTYPGDQTHMAQAREVKGPSMFDEYVEVVVAEYDPKTRTTRVGFRHISKDEIRQRLQDDMRAQVESQR